MGREKHDVFPAAAMGRPHAFDGQPRMVALGLREAWNAQRNGFTAARNMTSRDHLPYPQPYRAPYSSSRSLTDTYAVSKPCSFIFAPKLRVLPLVNVNRARHATAATPGPQYHETGRANQG